MAMTNCRQYSLDTLLKMTEIKCGFGVTIPKAITRLNNGREHGKWWQDVFGRMHSGVLPSVS